MSESPIFLLSGPPGAGKSSVATALMQHFERGIHIPMDDIREWVVSGISHPSAGWSDETERQFKLARTVGASAATLYADAGFAVALADVLSPPDVAAHFTDPRNRKTLLLPTLDTALERNATRTNKTFNTLGLTELIRRVYGWLQQQDWSGWTILDSTNLTLEETVDAILERTR